MANCPVVHLCKLSNKILHYEVLGLRHQLLSGLLLVYLLEILLVMLYM